MPFTKMKTHWGRSGSVETGNGELRVKFSGGGDGGFVPESCLTLATPWTEAHQASLSMGFPKQEYWSGLPFLSPGDLPDPRIEATSCILFIGRQALYHQCHLASLQILELLVCTPLWVRHRYHLGSADRWRWGSRSEPGKFNLQKSVMKEVSAEDLKKQTQCKEKQENVVPWSPS